MGPYDTLNEVSTNGVPNAERIAILALADKLGLDISALPLGTTLVVSKTLDIPYVGGGTTSVKFGANGVAFDVDTTLSIGDSLEVLGFNAGMDFSVGSEIISFSVGGGEEVSVSRESFGPEMIRYFQLNHPELWSNPDFQDSVQLMVDGVLTVQTGLAVQEREMLQLLRAGPAFLSYA